MSSFARASLLSFLLLSVPTMASANLFRGGDVDVVSSPSGAVNPFTAKEQRIIGGSEAPEDRYPYAVSLQDSGGHFCGGSLISPDTVLTAAHCIDGGGTILIRIGSDDVNQGERIAVRKQMEHPDYNDNTDENDFGLLFLEEPTSLNIPFIRLNDDGNYPPAGSTAHSMGWGNRDDGGGSDFPDLLETVGLEVISNDACENAKEGGDSYNGWIYPSMICTDTKGKDACQGDSGGPLVIHGDDPSGSQDRQVGVVSWGIGCAFLPGVFARVSDAHDWIKDTVCEESNDPGPLCGTPEPTPLPTKQPTPNPTKQPTKLPTKNPTKNPTKMPTAFPTKYPTLSPTKRPTNQPTTSPTTAEPTLSPTETPTSVPSLSTAPSDSPSASPTVSAKPTSHPTDSPSISLSPTGAPSSSPSTSSQPTESPSMSQSPSAEPTAQPSISHSPTISFSPSAMPTLRPSRQPSSQPSSRPSVQPSAIPSSSPSTSKSPSTQPSFSGQPSLSAQPTLKPTEKKLILFSTVEAEQVITGNSLLYTDLSVVADEKDVQEKNNSSATMGISFAMGALLSGAISLWMML